MKRPLLWLLLIPPGVLVWWGWSARNRPPEMPFAKVRRETLVSTLPTNGKVEPIEWSAVRADGAGVVDSVPVQDGVHVAPGTVLATLRQTGLDAEAAGAEARVAQARAELSALESGGRSAELAEIENSLRQARQERETAERERSALERLAAKDAATRQEVDAARDRVRDADLRIEALVRKRASLVGASELAAAAARLREAESELRKIREQAAQTVLRAPLGGTVYGLAVRPGAYVNPGDLVANIGRIERVRVRVYVDEPELGRVQVGQPVTITWDALPGRRWEGTVERKPSEIQALGTRQVGEVLCTVDNPGRELIPGTNVNAEIRTQIARNVLTIPKEALRREPGGVGVYVLRGDTLEWRNVATGASSVTRVEITAGLREGDPVALPSERAAEPGMRVRATYP